jgi:hypothetical protein
MDSILKLMVILIWLGITIKKDLAPMIQMATFLLHNSAKVF